MIDQLKALLARLEESLAKCRTKYDDNHRLLQHLDGLTCAPRERCPNLFNEQVMQLIQYCGVPYFKTRGGKFAPPNQEALYRKQQRALYPHDFNREVRRQWTMADKTLLLQSIRESIVEYVRLNPTKAPPIHWKAGLLKLLSSVQDLPFSVNWQQISDMIFNRHTPNECEAMWRLNLHPGLNRGRWTDEEDDALLEKVREFNFQNWEKIAASLGSPRSMLQCFLNYQTKFMNRAFGNVKKFTPEEDAKLVELVSKHKIGTIIPWTTISCLFPGRSKQTLYNRYVFSLRPNISREKFSVEEDCIFLAALQEYGVDFRKIATEFPNRTTVQLRAHYNNVLKRNSDAAPWTLEEDEKMLKMHKEGFTWAQIADSLKTHNRMACRTRYTTITNFLAKHPEKTLTNVFRRKRGSRNKVTTANWHTKLIEIGQTIDEIPNFSETEMIKLASFAKILDVHITDELITAYLERFSGAERSMLRAVKKQKPSALLDFPMHKGTIVAFDRIRQYLEKEPSRETGPKEPPIEVDEKITVEKDNFKKQFKALFYLPAVLTSINGGSNTTTTTIDSEYGPIMITIDD